LGGDYFVSCPSFWPETLLKMHLGPTARIRLATKGWEDAVMMDFSVGDGGSTDSHILDVVKVFTSTKRNQINHWGCAKYTQIWAASTFSIWIVCMV
jgi:hypothetical protein